MNFDDHDIKKVVIILVMLVLAVLMFFLIKPVLLSVIAGLLLTYIFTPLYKKIVSPVKSKTIAALIVSVIVIIIIVLPLWFITPIMLQQVFDLFAASQGIEFTKVISAVFPTSTPQFVAQMSITMTNFVGQVSSSVLKSLTSFFLDLPILTLHIFIVFFVFFYGLRDGDKFNAFMADLSPFNKSKEKILVQQFKSITDTVVYGQIIVGLVQGGLAGLGFLLFGIDNALVLTTLAIFFSILPIVGPFLIWIPVAIYLFTDVGFGIGMGYLLYNLLIVSTVDNFLRTYLVSRKTDISPAIILVAMIGGLFIFGILGLVLGPLIAAYFILVLQAYREKTLSHLFHSEEV